MAHSGKRLPLFLALLLGPVLAVLGMTFAARWTLQSELEHYGASAELARLDWLVARLEEVYGRGGHWNDLRLAPEESWRALSATTPPAPATPCPAGAAQAAGSPSASLTETIVVERPTALASPPLPAAIQTTPAPATAIALATAPIVRPGSDAVRPPPAALATISPLAPPARHAVEPPSRPPAPAALARPVAPAAPEQPAPPLLARPAEVVPPPLPRQAAVTPADDATPLPEAVANDVRRIIARLSVLDADGRPLAGDLKATVFSARRPLQHQGRVIGYLALRQAAPDAPASAFLAAQARSLSLWLAIALLLALPLAWFLAGKLTEKKRAAAATLDTTA